MRMFKLLDVRAPEPIRTLKRGAARPVSLYRLSAVCQPTVEILVAGAGFEPATFGL